MNRASDMDKGLTAAPPAEALGETSAQTLAQLPPPRPSAGALPAIPPSQLELGGKLAGLTLPRQVLVLAVWPFFEQVLNFLVGFVDTWLAGRISVEATNAIGAASYIGWGMSILQSSVGIGATAVVARAVGGKRTGVANAALGQAMIMSVVMGFLSGALIFWLAPDIARWTEMRGASYDLTVVYLRIIALAAPFSSLLLVGSACLRASGDTRSPFLVLAVINVVNAVVSYAMVFAPAPIGGHGVAGIAWGTAAAWVVGAGCIIAPLLSTRGAIRLRWFRLRPHWHTMRRIVRVAAASLFESLGMWAGNFVVFMMVGTVGITMHAAPGAHIIAVRIEAISYLPCMALGIAASTLVGQYLGLGDPQRARRAAVLCWQLGVAIMTLWGVIFVLWPQPLVRLVTNNAELLELTPPLLVICGFVQPLFGTAIVLSNALRGAGDTRNTMRLMYLSIYLVRVPAVYIIAIHLDRGIKGIWYALCGELVVRGLIFAGRFLHGGWTKVKV